MSVGPGGPLLGSGGWYQPSGPYGPRGPYGPYPSCGCSTLFFILAVILLGMGGCLRMFNL